MPLFQYLDEFQTKEGSNCCTNNKGVSNKCNKAVLVELKHFPEHYDYFNKSFGSSTHSNCH